MGPSLWYHGGAADNAQTRRLENKMQPPVLEIPGAANGTIQLGLIVHLHGHKCHEP